MNTEQSLLDAALAYAERGWPVFPLRERGKMPLVPNGFHAATTDAATIRVWWQRWPRANIGLPMGIKAGVIAVDIDPRHGGDACFEQLVELHGEPPLTPRSNTGGGGIHLLFKYQENVRNSAQVIGPGIDTRGEGGYIVAPPSVHESGRRYEWDEEGDPALIVPADLPDWLNPNKASPGQLRTGNLSFLELKPKADGSPVAEGGRNEAAASLAGQCIRAGDSLHETMRKLNGWNKTNLPPLPIKELETTVASVARTHVRNNPGAEIAVIEEPPPVELAIADEPVSAPFPAHLLTPPGIIGDLCRWINETAIKPQPELTLGNVLAFFGAVVGRKVRTPTDLRTNLYVLGVGESGCGKDHSRKCIKKVCAAAGLTSQLLGGEEVSSDSAIFAAVYAHPSILFQFDEIGHFLANASSKYAASHQKNIAPTFTKLFSSSATTLIGKEYASGADRKDIDQPNVCLYGTTVPGRLYDGLSPGEIADGFLGRMLVFKSSDADPMERDTVPTQPPAAVVESIQAWFGRRDLPRAEGNIAAVTEHIPATVEMDEEAIGIMRAFRVECRELKRRCRDGSGLDALWSRAAEHAAKIALVLACGCQFQGPVISASLAAYAVELVKHLVAELVRTVGESVAGSDYERDLLYVSRLVRNAGPKGITKTMLLRTAQRIRSQSLDEMLNRLVAAGRILKQERKTGGRSATAYVSVVPTTE